MKNFSSLALEKLVMKKHILKIRKKRIRWRILSILMFGNRMEYRLEYKAGLFGSWEPLKIQFSLDDNVTVDKLEEELIFDYSSKE